MSQPKPCLDVDHAESFGHGAPHQGVASLMAPPIAPMTPRPPPAQQCQRGRAHDRGRAPVVHEGRERRICAGRSLPARSNGGHRTDAAEQPDTSARPLSRPVGRLVMVTRRTRVRDAQRDRQIGSRDPKPVIPAGMHDHVVPDRHVARGTRGTRRAALVEMVRRRVVCGWQMALRAHTIAGTTSAPLCGL